MKKHTLEDWLEIVWERPLSPGEERKLEGYLARHPAARSEWELEKALNRVLKALPNPPLSPGFTAGVMGRIEREAGRVARRPTRRLGWRVWRGPGWKPRWAVAAFSVFLAATGYFEFQAYQAHRLANSIATVLEAETLPSLEELRHFDVIHGLARVPAEVDWELIMGGE